MPQLSAASGVASVQGATGRHAPHRQLGVLPVSRGCRRSLKLPARAQKESKEATPAADGGRLPLWKQVHFKDKKPVHDLAPVSLASVDDEDIRPRAADVAPLEKLPLWAAVHMKRKAEMNAAPMWQRVRSGREATSSSGPVATPIGEPPSSDHAGPVQAAVVAAPPPLWQTVHEDGKRLPEPFLWRMAMRKLDNWGPASEEVVVTPTSADDDDADSPEGTATGQREELQRHAAGDDAPRPAAQMVLIPEEQAEASTPPTAAAAAAAADGAEGGAAEGGGEPPLWLRVHRQRRRSDAGFFIVGGPAATVSNMKRGRMKEPSSAADPGGERREAAAAAASGEPEPESDWTAPFASTAFGIGIILLVQIAGKGPT